MRTLSRAMMALSAALLVASMAACSPGVTEGINLSSDKIPEELRDCKFYRIEDDSGFVLRVIRCPNSATGASWKVGKHRAYSSTMEATTPDTAEKVNEILKRADAEIARLEELKKSLK